MSDSGAILAASQSESPEVPGGKEEPSSPTVSEVMDYSNYYDLVGGVNFQDEVSKRVLALKAEAEQSNQPVNNFLIIQKTVMLVLEEAGLLKHFGDAFKSRINGCIRTIFDLRFKAFCNARNQEFSPDFINTIDVRVLSDYIFSNELASEFLKENLKHFFHDEMHLTTIQSLAMLLGSIDDNIIYRAEIDGALASLKEKIRDVLAAKIAAEESSCIDSLTEICNRRALVPTLEKCRSAEFGPAKYTVFFFDIDYFKKVNDDYGHAAGDSVLKEFAGRLSKFFRWGEVHRYGGEEFCGFVPAYRALQLANDILKAISDVPFTLPDGRSIPITCSIGVCTGPKDQMRLIEEGDPSDVQSLYDKADKAMYLAKRGGRNSVHVHEEKEPAGG